MTENTVSAENINRVENINMENQAPAPVVTESPEKKKNNVWMIVAIVTAGVSVLLLAGIGYLWVNKNKDQSENQNAKIKEIQRVEMNKVATDEAFGGVTTNAGRARAENAQVMDPQRESEKEKKTYFLGDYVIITDHEVQECNREGTKCQPQYTLKQVTFKNLPELVIADFKNQNQNFINQADLTGIETFLYANKLTSEVDGQILSLSMKEAATSRTDKTQKTYNMYSVNVNLEAQRVATNQELLAKFNITAAEMFRQMLVNLANNVAVERFWLKTADNAALTLVTMDDFKRNIDKYAQYLDNQEDKVILFIENGQLNAAFTDEKILADLNISSDKNEGLRSGIQTVVIRY